MFVIRHGKLRSGAKGPGVVIRWKLNTRMLLRFRGSDFHCVESLHDGIQFQTHGLVLPHEFLIFHEQPRVPGWSVEAEAPGSPHGLKHAPASVTAATLSTPPSNALPCRSLSRAIPKTSTCLGACSHGTCSVSSRHDKPPFPCCYSLVSAVPHFGHYICTI